MIERIGNALCEGRRLGEGEGVIERIGNALCEGREVRRGERSD